MKRQCHRGGEVLLVPVILVVVAVDVAVVAVVVDDGAVVVTYQLAGFNSGEP